ncbi:hypothetical protein XA68_12722 [Ophiocordyceps unilateralis]|uniref:Cep57 centrosome microtubule-binding domain-containing protein n=1 Tax=Ophiocordyceps unilateralis TaxID=268505 RepID=A0A2A9PMQ7_OPHUN|nr:hypothetical protein XA68_12722 [Ophiocordyceps unilateralis]
METDRYRSRILREVQANRQNPFNSPPSSTGSRGSDSPTLSSVFSDPDGESTRRLHADIARVTASRKLPVNWEAAHRKWPEFFSMPSKEAKAIDDSTTNPLPTQTRADMQPRVDNESDLSPALRSKRCSPLPKDPASHSPQRRSSITEALDRLRRASLSPPVDAERRLPSRESASPPTSSAKSSLTAVPPSPGSTDGHTNRHSTSFVRSFLMPDVSHLGDFVTGTLKFSGSMKNGVPIFVKNGKVHDRRERPHTDAHAAIDGIEVPQVEEKIFVSMDMIRDEIISLQKHYDQVQKYAENLQKQVQSLETQVESGKTQHRGQSSDRLATRNDELELEVASLKARLDVSQRKATDSEMEKISLAHEKDRAVSRLQSACDDISKLTHKLNVKSKELESSHKQLETTEQIRHDNDTLRRDLSSLKHGHDGLERENASLRAENEALRKEVKQLREEMESLRKENNSLRRGDESLLMENRSLRSINKSLSIENEHLRDNLDGVQHEVDAAREQVERLERQVGNLSREKTTLQHDNEKLVQHSDKYFSENKILRREKSSNERSTHELQEVIVRLREEVELLKQQPDHCRPLPTNDDFSARLDEETEENMTSAFFVPDITINTNEATETAELPAPAELTSRSHKTAKVAFTVPDQDKTAQSDKNIANKGSKRRKPAKKSWTRDVEDTTDALSVDDTTQEQQASVSLNVQRLAARQQKQATKTMDCEAKAASTCPAALSPDARRILDGLCQHNCRNCIVCSRITSHVGVITAGDISAGKKHISLSRPIPVTDRLPGDDDDQDMTSRPSQAPGQALALVIKGLEDEGQHMQMELRQLQRRYNETDKSLGRRRRKGLADDIRTLLKRLEVKNDQIYSLFDVLEGQKLAAQAMTEDEVELTVLSITGLSVRDLAARPADLCTWEDHHHQQHHHHHHPHEGLTEGGG